MILRLSCGVSAPESRLVWPPVPLAASATVPASSLPCAISCAAAVLVAVAPDAPPHPVNRPVKRAAASAAAIHFFLCFICVPSLFFGKTTKFSMQRMLPV